MFCQGRPALSCTPAQHGLGRGPFGLEKKRDELPRKWASVEEERLLIISMSI